MAMGEQSDDTRAVSGQPGVSRFHALRVWPAVLLLVTMVATRFVPSMIEDGPPTLWMVAAFGPLLCSALVLVWWLVASRARWQERLIGLAGVVVGVCGTMILSDQSMRGPATMLITVPMGMAAFGLAALFCSGVLSFRRTFLTVLLAVCGFGFSTLLRADGMWGNNTMGLHWRWQESAEEHLLAFREQAPEGSAGELPPGDHAAALLSPEWPAFRGAYRSGSQRGTRLATDWATKPPEQLWKIPVGPAWSSFVVAGDLLFTQEQRGPMESVVCYDARSGQEVWSQQVESRFSDPLGGPGPRATPTLAEGQLFVMGAQGYLMRLEAETGRTVWKQDLREVAARQPPTWGFASSPLITDGVVIVHAGGAGDQGLLGFDTETGQLRWSAASGDHSYSSPCLCQFAGVPLVAMLTNEGVTLHDPATGSQKLRYDWAIAGYRVLQPRLVNGNSLLVPTGMGSGTRLVRITQTGDSLIAEDLWTSRDLKPDFNDFVVAQGYLYGFDGAIFTCIDLDNGERRWKGGRYGKGQVLLLEDSGLLLIASEYGDVVLVKADPSAHSELAKFRAIEGKTWNHPVVVGDRLYLRNAEEAACFRLPLAEPAAQADSAPAPAGSAQPL